MLKRLDGAAIQIQRAYRGHRSRRRLAERHIAAARIQAAWRGCAARAKIARTRERDRELRLVDETLARTRDRVMRRERELRELKGVDPSRVRDLQLQKITRAVIVVQAWFRGWRVRRDMKMKGIRKKSGRRVAINLEDGPGEVNEWLRRDADEREEAHSLIALAEEADEMAIRLEILKRLDAVKKEKLAELANNKINGIGGDQNDEGNENSVETATIATIMAGMAEVERLLDQTTAFDSSINKHRDIPISEEDISLGCRPLRKKIDLYLEKMIACIDSLDLHHEEALPLRLFTPQIRAESRKAHLRALKDGNMRWWEYDELTDDDALEELIDLPSLALSNEPEGVY